MRLIKFDAEKIFFIILSLTFFVGIWHALPMFAVINDESYFVGGVLRAMENHSIVPAVNDVPYGTLTYLLNYFLSIIIITILLPFFKFDLYSLKLFLIQSPQVMYLSLRFLSAMIGIVTLFLVNKLLKNEFEDYKTRFFLLILLFTNIIITTIFHTGKVWVIATVLVLFSFYFLYKTLISEDSNQIKKYSLLSIIFAFLALADFPLNLFCLINIPLLLYFYWNDREIRSKVFLYLVFGLIAFLIIVGLNFHSVFNQVFSVFKSTGEHPLNNGFIANLHFFESFFAYSKRVFLLFPLFILTLLLIIKEKVKNKKLLIMGVSYFVSYFLSIVVVANWNMELELSLRYVFPLGFFFLFILASFDIKFKKLFYFIGSFSIIYYIFTLYYLSIPTTYNLAYNWVGQNLSSKEVTIVNPIRELQLIKNKKSDEFIKPEFCVTKCKNIIKYDLNKDFKPLVLDKDSFDFDITKLKGEVYYIDVKEVNLPGFNPYITFNNPTRDYHSVDYNLGNYFDIDFFRIKNLGKNVYIYRKI